MAGPAQGGVQPLTGSGRHGFAQAPGLARDAEEPRRRRRLALHVGKHLQHGLWPQGVGGVAGQVLGLVVALLVEPGARSGAWWHEATAASWLAWGYLVVMGTLVTLNAYLWLLQNTSAALAGSYSFVNPAVALWVGVTLGGERLTGWVFAAMPLILAALALILYGRQAASWVTSWAARVLPASQWLAQRRAASSR